MIRIFQARATDNMPTAARAVAAIALGAVSAAMVFVLMIHYPEARMRKSRVLMGCIIICLSINNLLKQILRDRLRGADPVEAVYTFANTALEYSAYLLNGKLLLTAAFLSVTVGVLTRNTARRWR